MPSFNWVEARSLCTPTLQFDLLAEEVTSNVAYINQSDSRNGNVTFTVTFNRKLNGKLHEIIVARCRENIPDASIVFRLSQEAIVITRPDRHGHHTPLFEAIPRLLDDTSGKLEMDHVPVEIWQVSRRALERLFFG